MYKTVKAEKDEEVRANTINREGGTLMGGSQRYGKKFLESPLFSFIISVPRMILTPLIILRNVSRAIVSCHQEVVLGRTF